MRVFWHLWMNLGRIQAEERRDLTEDIAYASAPEAAGKRIEALDEAAPSPIKLTGQALMQANSQRDSDAADSLRSLS